MFVFLFVNLFIYLFVCVFIYLFVYYDYVFAQLGEVGLVFISKFLLLGSFDFLSTVWLFAAWLICYSNLSALICIWFVEQCPDHWMCKYLPQIRVKRSASRHPLINLPERGGGGGEGGRAIRITLAACLIQIPLTHSSGYYPL
jgi:hypothetical protein